MTAATIPTLAPAQTRAANGDPSVLAIVVTHQGRRWLKDCLVALCSQTYPFLDVLVVDDASPDWRDAPHLKRLVKRHLRRRRWGFLRTRRPLGFGGAINWALSRVRTSADLLLFLHDDVVLDPSSVQRMVERMSREPNAGIVGPKIVSWDDPGRLEEVGMAVDRFGYPYKGLEVGEIDLGQHDHPTEVFYVTSTCMLVRHDVFRQLRGWDAPMRAFSEDLDLCWRARVTGSLVLVEPAARARHAIALATGQRSSRFLPPRYFIRRNRLRAVAKNVSAPRLLALVPQFVLLSITEMVGFTVLRQPGEIVNLAKALGWNFVTSPQTMSERLRVQRARVVPDRRLRRLTVRESTRVHAYVSNQAERMEQAWGRRAEVVAARSTQARALSRSLAGLPATAGAVLALALLVGFRHFLWSGPATVGQLVPFPPQVTALWRSYFSPWQQARLGAPGPASPAVLLLGVFPVLALGIVGAAQKLLVLVLGATGFAGAYRLVSEVVDRRARVVAGLVYVLGPVGYAGLRGGALGALVLAAAAPFALRSILRLTGWLGRGRGEGGRSVARVAVAAAVGGAFVPGSLLVLAAASVILSAVGAALDPRPGARRGLLACLAGLVVAWTLLLPWSATWLREGGPLHNLWSEATWRGYASGFAGEGMTSVLSGRLPPGPLLSALAMPLLGGVAVALGTGRRRRLALGLVAVLVGTGWLVAATAAGLVRPVVASPAEAGVFAGMAWAGLAGLAVAAFGLDLPRRRLGWMHAGTIGALGAAGVLVLGGLAPTLWRGDWGPGRASPNADPAVTAQVVSLLGAEADGSAQFRALWVGSRWSPGSPDASRPGRRDLVTGPQGELLSDAFSGDVASSDAELAGALASIEDGSTDVGGHLLGAFNIRFVVLARAAGASRWLAQRDLEVIRSEPDFILLESSAPLPRAAVWPRLPGYVAALARRDPRLGSSGREAPRAVLGRRSAGAYAAAGGAPPGVVWLAESHDPRWSASAGGTSLARVEGGWGNAFVLPRATSDPVSVTYPRSPADLAWAVALVLAWVVALGAALSGARSIPERPP